MAAASSGYTWERRSYAFDQTSNSDPATGVWDDASEDEPEDSDVSGVEAGECFVQFLLQLHFAGKLSAKSVCVACWFAHKAGAVAPVGQYAFRPNAPSGHYQRHLDLVTGVRVKEEVAWRYTVDIPQHAKYDLSRSSHECIINVPHEVLNEEILGNAGILEKVAATTWPRAYYQNPVFQRRHGPVVPLALYLDGVPTTKKDGALGFWIYNLVTMRRHLIAVIRKSTMCKCGCKGWDSIHPLWCFLRWTLEAMSLGAFPYRRHDSRAWKAPDEQRAQLGGTPLAFRGMLLQIKGDWAEFSSSLGFTNWAATLAPCLFCRCTQASLADFGGWSPLSPVHALVGHADFEAACGACEQKRRLSKAEWQLVKNSLAYVKASDGPRGRALLCDLPSLGLLKHDRLEPDLVLQDIAWFDDALSFPVNCTFWRRPLETRVRRRAAIFDGSLGVTLDTLCIDVLRCIVLGPALDWWTAVFWALLGHDVYNVSRNMEQRIVLSCFRIKADLWDFYKRWRSAHPGEDLTQVQDFTPGMLGSNTRRALSLKAMETNQILPFCAELLRTFAEPLGSLGAALASIGTSPQGFLALLHQSEFVVPAENIQTMFDQWNRVYRLWTAAGLHVRPKLHLTMHMCERAKWQGNPAAYATWVDEGLNKVMANLARQSHRSVWELRILAYFEEFQRHASKRQRF